ncbi:hypothetical protein SDC9_119948 [bioreactor metagenome]|uniref:HTH cro/C1-type domain-containing protein n=1 Tax=bioreactor metagenome TaxID=1076179 RepID=A0A645C5P6_9ZZZZ
MDCLKQLIGNRIRELRENRNLSPSELASQLGVTSTSVYNWEQGRNLPASELLPSLAKALNTTIDHIMRYGSKDQITQSMTKYFFDLDLEEYSRAVDLIKLSDEVKLDTEMEFRLVSMEMTHIMHQSRELMSRLDTLIQDFGEHNQSLALRMHRQKLQLQIFFQGGTVVLAQLKHDSENNPSFLTKYKQINGLLLTDHSTEALNLCKETREEYPSKELDILLAECKWISGELDEAMNDLRTIMKNRTSYSSEIVIRAHEVLYRILLQKQDFGQIVEILKDSINWLPEEYAKDGYDAMQARKSLKNRLKRLDKQV